MNDYIPTQMYCAMSTYGDKIYGHITPDGTNKQAMSRKKTIDKLGDSKFKPLVFDNTPMVGFKFYKFKTSSTGDGYVLVEDPRNFISSIPLRDFEDILQSTSIVDGVIRNKCVWVRSGSNNKLVVEGSDEFIQAQQITMGMNNTISKTQLNVNDYVTLSLGRVGKFLGSYNVVRFEHVQVNENNQTSGNNSLVDSEVKIKIAPKRYYVFLIGKTISLMTNFKIFHVETRPDASGRDDYEDWLNEKLCNDSSAFNYNTCSTMDDRENTIVGFISKKLKNIDPKISLKVSSEKLSTFKVGKAYYRSEIPTYFIIDNNKYYGLSAQEKYYGSKNMEITGRYYGLTLGSETFYKCCRARTDYFYNGNTKSNIADDVIKLDITDTRDIYHVVVEWYNEILDKRFIRKLV